MSPKAQLNSNLNVFKSKSRIEINIQKNHGDKHSFNWRSERIKENNIK